jgi:hypothetical protein
MDKLKERIDTLKGVEKLINEHKKENEPEAMKTWNAMGLCNPWYVINEKNNIIKFEWREAFTAKNICVVVIWDKKYINCKLFYSNSKIHGNNHKTMDLNKSDIEYLEKYLENNDFFNYNKIEDSIQFDGSSSELEVKINENYNVEDDCNCINSKIIYNFANILFELSKEDIGNILGT